MLLITVCVCGGSQLLSGRRGAQSVRARQCGRIDLREEQLDRGNSLSGGGGELHLGACPRFKGVPDEEKSRIDPFTRTPAECAVSG